MRQESDDDVLWYGSQAQSRQIIAQLRAEPLARNTVVHQRSRCVPHALRETRTLELGAQSRRLHGQRLRIRSAHQEACVAREPAFERLQLTCAERQHVQAERQKMRKFGIRRMTVAPREPAPALQYVCARGPRGCERAAHQCADGRTVDQDGNEVVRKACMMTEH